MEWVEGNKLGDAWSEITPEKIHSVCNQLLDGLGAIHGAGICHRDLHAGNVMIAGEAVEVIDVQYTESAHLSQFNTQSRQDAVRQDIDSAIWLIRNLLLNVSMNLLTAEIDSELRSCGSLEELQGFVDKRFATSFGAERVVTTPASDTSSIESRHGSENGFGFRPTLDRSLERIKADFYSFRSRPATVIAIHSLTDNRIDFEKTLDEINGRALSPEVNCEAIVWKFQCGIVELDLDDRVLLHVYSGDYESFRNQHRFTMHARLKESEGIPNIINEFTLLTNIVRHVHDSCRLLDDIGLTAPWEISLAVVGAEGFKLVSKSGTDVSASASKNEIRLPPLRVTDFSEVSTYGAAGVVLGDTLKRLTRVFGIKYSSCFTSNGTWNARLV